jgi:hypothetical protein
MHRVIAELTLLMQLLHELFVPSILHIPLKCDGQATIHIAMNLVHHERTKHFKVDGHF